MNGKGRGAARAVADLSAGIVLATVEIAAPAERVFQALASSEIVRWWGKPGTFDTREWAGDLRVGGSWRAAGIANGQPWALEGEFLELDPPRKLAHTWRMPGAAGAPSVVTYLLETVDGGTRVTLRHSGVDQRAACMGACAGWESSLANLAQILGGLNA